MLVNRIVVLNRNPLSGFFNYRVDKIRPRWHIEKWVSYLREVQALGIRRWFYYCRSYPCNEIVLEFINAHATASDFQQSAHDYSDHSSQKTICRDLKSYDISTAICKQSCVGHMADSMVVFRRSLAKRTIVIIPGKERDSPFHFCKVKFLP